MARQAIFIDELSRYDTQEHSPYQIACAVAKTYTKSWSLASTVNGSPYPDASTVDYKMLPHPNFQWDDFKTTKVNIEIREGLLVIEFT